MMSRSARPWRMIMPLAAVLILFAAWSAYWFIAAAAVRDQAEAMRESLARQGISLVCDGEDWGGYPFRFEFLCSESTILLPLGAVHMGQVQLVAQAYNPWHVIALIEGPTQVMLSGASHPLMHRRSIVSVNFRDRNRPRLSAEIMAAAAAGQFSAARIGLYARRADDERPEIAIDVEGLDITIPGKPSLRLDAAGVIAKLVTLRQAEIESVALRQGKLTLTGSGQLVVDGQHHLLGKLATETNDIDALLAAIEPYADLSAKDRSTVKTVLGLLGSTAKADLIFKQGEIFWGPFKIADVAPLY